MAGVVLCLGAFSVFAAYTTQIQVTRAQDAETLLTAYEGATTAAREAELAESAYLLDPSSQTRAALGATDGPLIQAITDIGSLGGPADAQVAREMRGQLDLYLLASTELAALVVAGDIAGARRIDIEEIHPIFRAVAARLESATADQAATTSEAFAILRETAQTVLILAPTMFAIGLVLMFVLWRTRERYHRRVEHLSRVRGEFVAMISHEFRTPLTGIQGFSEMLRDEKNLSMDDMREYAGDINVSAQRLAGLIIDFVDRDPELSAREAPAGSLGRAGGSGRPSR